MDYNWTSLLGEYKQEGECIIFKGGIEDGGYSSVGNLLTNQAFGEGKISAKIKFNEISVTTGCQIIVYYDSNSSNFLCAGIGSGSMYTIRTFAQNWNILKATGNFTNLIANKVYNLEIDLFGSTIQITVDGIKVLSTNLNFNLPVTQIGLWNQSNQDIEISALKVERQQPKAFIVMPFSSPYNELYTDVIKNVCKNNNLKADRGDESFGPGLIINDIINQIVASKVVIAEITETNANVFYEVGYAHAMGKPTILLAQNGTILPFDVSSFRTLFYENSIAGKEKVMKGLDKHLKAALGELEI